MALSSRYIWQRRGWPAITYRRAALTDAISRARLAQGTLQGLAQAVGLERNPEILRDIWIDEALGTASIEGEKLNVEAVRSSVLRKLGAGKQSSAPRNVDALIDVMDDAARNFSAALTHTRLCRWQAALFPGGRSGLARIETGRYRSHADPMQIVSGNIGREIVHYTAPASANVRGEMSRFLAWFRASQSKGAAGEDGLVRAAIAHLWFETIHPFEDGNGRIGRAICDLALAQDAGSATRLVSLSRQLNENRKEYYEQLGVAQRGGLDVTPWVIWSTRQIEEACYKSAGIIRAAVDKARFWRDAPEMNERQKKAVQKLLDAGEGGFEGGMSAEKYANLTRTSKATATRDLTDLAARGVLEISGQGRGTRYALAKHPAT